jgi:hypothetical protein
LAVVTVRSSYLTGNTTEQVRNEKTGYEIPQLTRSGINNRRSHIVSKQLFGRE